MKKLFMIALAGVLAAATPVNARTIWDEIGDTTPRSIWDEIRDTSPVRKPDSLNDGLVGE